MAAKLQAVKVGGLEKVLLLVMAWLSWVKIQKLFSEGLKHYLVTKNGIENQKFQIFDSFYPNCLTRFLRIL